MNKSQTKNSLFPAFTTQEAADALNEQGFLFQQIIRETIWNGIVGQKEQQQSWNILANEYPVTAVDGSQTRIDLVLSHTQARNVFICLECKRSNPKYKTWLFFDRDKTMRLFIEDGRMESGKAYDSSNPIDYKQVIASQFSVTDIPIFNFYLEATVKKSGNDKSSNSETIEKALRQLIAGHSGMMSKLRIYERDAVQFYRSIPVIVTTAQLFEAKFDCNDVSVNAGTIEPSLLNLIPHKFCAINYHPDDSLSIQRQHSNHRKADVSADMDSFQTRTVFIVQSAAINDFLLWAGEQLTRHP